MFAQVSALVYMLCEAHIQRTFSEIVPGPAATPSQTRRSGAVLATGRN
jgi:hypothetical protein